MNKQRILFQASPWLSLPGATGQMGPVVPLKIIGFLDFSSVFSIHSKVQIKKLSKMISVLFKVKKWMCYNEKSQKIMSFTIFGIMTKTDIIIGNVDILKLV